MDKLIVNEAIVVEGRDDVRAVQSACEALIIPTHGYGITAETWQVVEKAYGEKGIIILTDPDHAGREIRRRLSEKFPEAIQAYLDREDARAGSDIGIENAEPGIIRAAIERALELAGRKTGGDTNEMGRYAEMQDLIDLGLAAAAGSSERRSAVCKVLGIGYCNASAMITKMRGFGIDIDELKEASRKIQ